eukprot:scaffold83251_cov36-Phaeocystis_antarctica.AAC.1
MMHLSGVCTATPGRCRSSDNAAVGFSRRACSVVVALTRASRTPYPRVVRTWNALVELACYTSVVYRVVLKPFPLRYCVIALRAGYE